MTKIITNPVKMSVFRFSPNPNFVERILPMLGKIAKVKMLPQIVKVAANLKKV